MKRINTYIMTAAMAILAAGCAKETAPEVSVGEGVVFEASLADADAKAVLKPGKTASKVEWTKDDKVGVYAGTSYYEYKADKSGASSTLSPVGASSLAAEYYAVYPYDASATLAGGIITTTLPAEQTAVLGSFSHHLAVAHSESLTLNFKNVCGLLCLDVAESGVTKVELKGKNNEVLAGKIAVTVADTPSWNAVEGSQTVSLVAETGKTLSFGTYYLAVLPQTFADGVTVTTYFEDGSTFVKDVTESVTVAPSGMIGGKVAGQKGYWKIETVLGSLTANKNTNSPGTGAEASLRSPTGIAQAPDGSYWITTRFGSAQFGIWKMTPDYTLSEIAVVADDSDLSGSHPWHCSFNPDGVFHFAAKAVNKYMTCSPEGNVEVVSLTKGGNAFSQSNPMDVKFDDSGNMYLLYRTKFVKVTGGEVVREWTLSGSYHDAFCFNATKTAAFVFYEYGVYMIDLTSETSSPVKIAGATEKHTSQATYTDGTPGQPLTATFNTIEGAVCLPDGTLLFSDQCAKTIRRFVPAEGGDYTKGLIETVLGDPWSTSVGATAPATNQQDGIGKEGRLMFPAGIVLSSDGSIFVVDGTTNGVIRKITYAAYE